MKALQYSAPHTLEFVEKEMPTPKEDEILIKMKIVGVCGTDLHIYKGELDRKPPLIQGHEFVGEVVEVGSDITQFQIGDRVTGEHVVQCGRCRFCMEGKINNCENVEVIGITLDGAMAEYMTIRGELAYKLPDDMTNDEGVLVEPLSIGVYATHKTNIEPGDIVVVLGQGPIGIFVSQLAKNSGAKVYGVDVLQERLDFSESHGYIDEGVNPRRQNIKKCLLDKEGRGANVSFEVVGLEETLKSAVDITDATGELMVLGVFPEKVTIDLMQIIKKELILRGSYRCVHSFPETIKLISTGKIRTDGIITHRYPFSEGIQAFADAVSYSDNRIKTVIEF